MSAASQQGPPRRGRKVRVAFRRNRSQPARKKNWTSQAQDSDASEHDAAAVERVVPKGELSRHRTVIEGAESSTDETLRAGVVVAMRGLFADVDDGVRLWPCTIRRVLRTRQTDERHAVTIGDHVRFRAEPIAEGIEAEGVIESVEPRRGRLRRRVGRRIQTIAANVDQAIVVGSLNDPPFKPHLVDRYIVAALAGRIVPVVCLNKIDLGPRDEGEEVLRRYAALGYATFATSARTGEGIDALRSALRSKASVVAGQSGVGKSSLLNAVQPDLRLKVASVSGQTRKGRHTTSTAHLIRLEVGGYVVDTPGIRSLDLSPVSRNEFEACFVEFTPHIPNCKFPDCTHTHEAACAVKDAVERGEIHPERYASYVRMFEDPGEA